VEAFLMTKEQSQYVIMDETAEPAISVEDANFAWEYPRTLEVNSGTKEAKLADDAGSSNATSTISVEKMNPFALIDIKLTVKKGGLIAVIGSVGSGKTSLLSALAGEMHKTHGKVILSAKSRAFCPQNAWIQNATIRDNITFGRPMDQELYDKVIHSCCLGPDIEVLPAGDQTEIGERGINLSGGQRQRINLARAIYSESSIVLMDDPLSAVDAHVGKHIFEHAICGALQGKTRVLSTNQLHVLDRTDGIIVSTTVLWPA
jgi:ABC-type bacteriocin/lantibiotic exporter with double-glycine peptidase domain